MTRRVKRHPTGAGKNTPPGLLFLVRTTYDIPAQNPTCPPTSKARSKPTASIAAHCAMNQGAALHLKYCRITSETPENRENLCQIYKLTIKYCQILRKTQPRRSPQNWSTSFSETARIHLEVEGFEHAQNTPLWSTSTTQGAGQRLTKWYVALSPQVLGKFQLLRLLVFS